MYDLIIKNGKILDGISLRFYTVLLRAMISRAGTCNRFLKPV